MRSRMRLGRWMLGGTLVASLAMAFPAAASLNGEACVSKNNTAYFVLKTSDPRTHVTSVAFTTNTANSCVENSMEPVQTAVAVGGAALPDMVRTTVLNNLSTNANITGSCSPPSFDADAAGGFGILTLPNGVKISYNPSHADCGGTCIATTAVSNSDTTAGLSGAYSVPAAQEVNVSRFAMSGAVTSCAAIGNTLLFPLPAGANPTLSDGRTDPMDMTDTGEVPGQEATLDDTAGSEIGNPASQTTPDGFVLQGTCSGSPTGTCQLIVFIASQDGAPSFGYGAAGFITDSEDTQTDTDGFGTNREFNTPSPPPPREAPAMSLSVRAILVLLLAAFGVYTLRNAVQRP